MIVLLSACNLQAIRFDSHKLVNDTNRSVIIKLTCSRREFDGEYDRNFILGPNRSINIPLRANTVCGIESIDFKTPEELRLEVRSY